MREVNVPKMIGVLAITTLIFLAGIFLGKFLADAKLSTLEQTVSDVALQTASIEAEYGLLLEKPCNSKGFDKLTANLGELADMLVFNEAQKEQNKNRIASIKNNYFLLETRHWRFVEKLNSECHTNFTPILYFYSEEKCENCYAQGVVLSAIKEAHPEVMIYSFDTSTDYSLVDTIEDMYDVAQVPAIVINGTLYSEFLGQEALEIILHPKSVAGNNTLQNSSQPRPAQEL